MSALATTPGKPSAAPCLVEPKPSRVIVGIGFDLGDRYSLVGWAFSAWRRSPTLVETRRSSLWETAPVGGPPQPRYLNAALVGGRLPRRRRLSARLHGIERRAGQGASRTQRAAHPRPGFALDRRTRPFEKPTSSVPIPGSPNARSRSCHSGSRARRACDPGTQEPYERHLARSEATALPRAHGKVTRNTSP